MKYIFKQIDDISGANAVTTVEFSADTLSSVLEQFELFLFFESNPKGIFLGIKHGLFYWVCIVCQNYLLVG